jgi:hypothetical protein
MRIAILEVEQVKGGHTSERYIDKDMPTTKTVIRIIINHYSV